MQPEQLVWIRIRATVVPDTVPFMPDEFCGTAVKPGIHIAHANELGALWIPTQSGGLEIKPGEFEIVQEADVSAEEATQARIEHAVATTIQEIVQFIDAEGARYQREAERLEGEAKESKVMIGEWARVVSKGSMARTLSAYIKRGDFRTPMARDDLGLVAHTHVGREGEVGRANGQASRGQKGHR